MLPQGSMNSGPILSGGSLFSDFSLGKQWPTTRSRHDLGLASLVTFGDLCKASHYETCEAFQTKKVHFSSVQGGVYLLGKAQSHMRSTLSHKFPRHCL